MKINYLISEGVFKNIHDIKTNIHQETSKEDDAREVTKTILNEYIPKISKCLYDNLCRNLVLFNIQKYI